MLLSMDYTRGLVKEGPTAMAAMTRSAVLLGAPCVQVSVQLIEAICKVCQGRAGGIFVERCWVDIMKQLTRAQPALALRLGTTLVRVRVCYMHALRHARA